MSGPPLDLFHGFHLDWLITPHRFGGLAAGIVRGVGDLESVGEGFRWGWKDWCGGHWGAFEPPLRGGGAGTDPRLLPQGLDRLRASAAPAVADLPLPAAERLLRPHESDPGPAPDAATFWNDRLGEVPGLVGRTERDHGFLTARVGRMPEDDAGLRVSVTRYHLPADAGLSVVRLPPVLVGRSGGHRRVRTPFRWPPAWPKPSEPPDLGHVVHVPMEALQDAERGRLDPSRPVHVLLRGFVCEPSAWVEDHVVPPPSLAYRVWRRMPSHLRRLAVRVGDAEWTGAGLRFPVQAGFQGAGAHWGDPFQQWDGRTGYGLLLLLDVVQGGPGWTLAPRTAAGARPLRLRFHQTGSRPDQRGELPVEVRGPTLLGLQGFEATLRPGPARWIAPNPGRLVRGIGVEVTHAPRPAVHLRYSNDGWVDFAYAGELRAHVLAMEAPAGTPLGIEPMGPHEPGVPPGADGEPNHHLVPL
jgi:hypothetical protein